MKLWQFAFAVCDESRYLIVRNVPSLGCGDDLLKLFASYGDVEECKPMDEADCDQFTDVYRIQFRLVTNARFAKRKLDEYAFLGNRLNVSYAPEFETLSDTKDKLESRGREVLRRLNPGRSKGSTLNKSGATGSTRTKVHPRKRGRIEDEESNDFFFSRDGSIE